MSLEANPSADVQEKQRLFIERARKGVLKFILDKGVPVPMGDLHDFTLQKFFIQHQGFSKLMEGMVADELLEYREGDGEFFLTDKGKNWASQG